MNELLLCYRQIAIIQNSLFTGVSMFREEKQTIDSLKSKLFELRRYL